MIRFNSEQFDDIDNLREQDHAVVAVVVVKVAFDRDMEEIMKPVALHAIPQSLLWPILKMSCSSSSESSS